MKKTTKKNQSQIFKSGFPCPCCRSIMFQVASGLINVSRVINFDPLFFEWCNDGFSEMVIGGTDTFPLFIARAALFKSSK